MIQSLGFNIDFELINKHNLYYEGVIMVVDQLDGVPYEFFKYEVSHMDAQVVVNTCEHKLWELWKQLKSWL